MITSSEALRTDLLAATRLAHVPLPPGSLRIELLGAPHQRPTLPPDTQAVYAFFLGDVCLKVGKAGPLSGARFTSQHYGLNAPSTLARSLLTRCGDLEGLVSAGRLEELAALDAGTIGPWLERNTSRVSVFLPGEAGREVLSLAEAFLQCRWKPVYEEG